MKQIHQRMIAAIALVFVVGSIGLLAQYYTSLDSLIAREISLRNLVRTHPLTAWVVGFGIYFGLSLLPSISGKAVVFGWLYGFWAGVVMVSMALTGAALTTFLTTRYLFREAIESRFGLYLKQFRKPLTANASFYLLTLRLMHAPFAMVNYVSGATNIVPLGTFCWTTQVGMLPGIIIFVLVGTRIPTLSRISEVGVLSLLDGQLIGVLLGTALLPLIIKTVAMQIRGPRNV